MAWKSLSGVEEVKLIIMVVVVKVTVNYSVCEVCDCIRICGY
jgi:hypothetical protein